MFVEHRLRADDRFMRGDHYTAMEREDRTARIEYADMWDLWLIWCLGGEVQSDGKRGSLFFTGDLSIAVRRANQWLGGESPSRLIHPLIPRLDEPGTIPTIIKPPLLPVRLRDNWWRLSGGVLRFSDYEHGKTAFLYPRIALQGPKYIHPVLLEWTRDGQRVWNNSMNGRPETDGTKPQTMYCAYQCIMSAHSGLHAFFAKETGDPDFSGQNALMLSPTMYGEGDRIGIRCAMSEFTLKVGFGRADVEAAKTDPLIIHGYGDISDMPPRTTSRLNEEGLIAVDRDEDMVQRKVPPKRKRLWG